MPHLTPRERELVSLGAAMGSNCISCIEHHVPASRNAGLPDAQISEAINLAGELRQVPARKTLDAAVRVFPVKQSEQDYVTGHPSSFHFCRRQNSAPKAARQRPAETKTAETPIESSMSPNSTGAKACVARAGAPSRPARAP